MRLLLRLNRSSGVAADVAVNVDGDLSVGELAAAIAAAEPARSGQPINLTIRVDGPERQAVLAPGLSARSGSLRSGQAVTLVDRSSHIDDTGDLGRRIATAIIVAGPDAGREFPLHLGANQIGRGAGNEVPLSDRMASRAHALINIGDIAEVVDLGSTNGVDVNGARIDRLVLRAQDVIRLGDTALRIEHHGGGGGMAPTTSEPVVAFNRPPYVHPSFGLREFETPTPPTKPSRQRFPVFILMMPLLMAGILFLATRQWQSVLFAALSPLMMIGSYVETKRANRQDFAEAKAYYAEELSHIGEEATVALADDAAERLDSTPSVQDCLEQTRRLGTRLWQRRPDRPLFLTLRFGIGTMPSRVVVKVPSSGDRRLLADARALAARFVNVDNVPVTADLMAEGSLGVGGDRGMALAAARAALVQVAGLHSPAEVVVAALASSASAGDWDWLKWLPHTGSAFSPLDCEHLTVGEAQSIALIEELERVVEQRCSQPGAGGGLAPMPAIVVVIEEDAPIPRSRLVPLLEQGRAASVHAVWVASGAPKVPAACRAFLTIDAAGSAMVGLVGQELATSVARLEIVTADEAELFARRLAGVVDAGAAATGVVDLPSTISYLELPGAGLALASDPAAVVDRWRESNSVRALLPERLNPKRPPNSLRAVVGAASTQPMVLDLRTDGPHALVAGTTGAGKSEFLQTWVLAMALTHSPERVTFLLVDYKGGAAFSLCDKLPHTVGMVTDLSPHLVRRAMRSLRAELHFRERLLERKGFKDLLEMERQNEPETPPSLVIVVDEFAALSKEVPEFVDGVVNVAQRGRSLGLHLVLATQRPAGVITDNIRANTNLRVSLRVADTNDSHDVVGVPTAGTFDPAVPGRGIAKLGPSKLVPFQTGYVGGWTTAARKGPTVHVSEISFGRTVAWEASQPARSGAHEVKASDPTDIQRLVSSVQHAAIAAGIVPPRRPWLPDLPTVCDVFLLRSPRDGLLSIGILDDPDHQRQIPARIDLDRDGSVAIFGTGGSGKSTLLRTAAATAALAEVGGPVHVYGLDFGGRGLQPLEGLPCVGSIVAGDDTERVTRLIRKLRNIVAERNRLFALVRASSLDEYRQAANVEVPRIIVLLDNYGAFTQAFDIPQLRWALEDVSALVSDGRAVGVHFLITADRRASMPPSRVSVQRRIVLRLANADEYGALDVESDVLGRDTPPGRALLDHQVVQIATPGGDITVNGQAAILQDLAAHLISTHPTWRAPAVESLPERIELTRLPATVERLPTFCVCDDGVGGIGAAGIPGAESFLVVGPRRSGRSTALATISGAFHRAAPAVPHHLVLGTRSHLAELPGWASVALGEAAATELLEKLAADLSDAGLSSGASDASGAQAVVFIDDANLIAGSGIEEPMEALLKAAREGRVMIVAAAELVRVNDVYSSFLKPLRQAQNGLILQADTGDPDIFNVNLPRAQRAAQPPGRGLLVTPQDIRWVQVAVV